MIQELGLALASATMTFASRTTSAIVQVRGILDCVRWRSLDYPYGRPNRLPRRGHA